MYSCPHKPIFYTSNYYDGSNVTRLIWSGNQVEDCTTQNCLEFHQDVYHDIILNIRHFFRALIILFLEFWSSGKYIFNHLQHLSPLMEKLDSCTRLSRKLSQSGAKWKHQHSTLVRQQYIGNTILVVFMLFNIKQLLLYLNTLVFLSVFYKKNLTEAFFPKI